MSQQKKLDIIDGIDQFSWHVSIPLSYANYYDTQTSQYLPLNKSFLDTKILIKKGDQVIIMNYGTCDDQEKIMFSETVNDNKIEDLFESIERGYQSNIQPSNDLYKINAIYKQICCFVKSKTRKDLVNKVYELDCDRLYLEPVTKKSPHTKFIHLEFGS